MALAVQWETQPRVLMGFQAQIVQKPCFFLLLLTTAHVLADPDTQGTCGQGGLRLGKLDEARRSLDPQGLGWQGQLYHAVP